MKSEKFLMNAIIYFKNLSNINKIGIDPEQRLVKDETLGSFEENPL